MSMSEPNPIKVDMTVSESVQRVDIGVSESGQQIPMEHTEVVVSTSTDYDDLFHKPSINGVELVGDLDSSDLGLQSALEFDDSPTEDSANPVTSGGVYEALQGKQDTISDLDTIRSGAALGATAVQHEVDPTVPAWAKASSKPTYTASEVGALPDSTAIPSKTSDLTNDSGFITQASIPVQSVNGQTGAVVLDADDVGALPDTTAIPTKTSDLQNDSGFITGITSANVTTALGYTPYNATNPSGYVNSTQAANSAPVQSVNGQTGAVSLTIPTVPTNVSAFTNDSGYLTLSTLPIYNGGVS